VAPDWHAFHIATHSRDDFSEAAKALQYSEATAVSLLWLVFQSRRKCNFMFAETCVYMGILILFVYWWEIVFLVGNDFSSIFTIFLPYIC